MLAVTVPLHGKFVCVIAGKVIGTSKHPDYFEYHYRLRNLKSVCAAELTKFVRIDDKGQIVSTLLAEALRSKDIKVAALPSDSLTDDELTVVLNAYRLVLPSVVSIENQSQEAVAPEPLVEIVNATPEPKPTGQASAVKRATKKPRNKSARPAKQSPANS